MKYFFFSIQHSEAVVQMCSVKKVFLEISQNSQESTCTRVSWILWNFQEHIFLQNASVAASEHSLRTFVINKKIVFTEKNKFKITKTYLNETMLENQER